MLLLCNPRNHSKRPPVQSDVEHSQVSHLHLIGRENVHRTYCQARAAVQVGGLCVGDLLLYDNFRICKLLLVYPEGHFLQVMNPSYPLLT